MAENLNNSTIMGQVCAAMGGGLPHVVSASLGDLGILVTLGGSRWIGHNLALAVPCRYPVREAGAIVIREADTDALAMTSVLQCERPVAMPRIPQFSSNGMSVAMEAMDFLGRQLSDELSALAMSLFCSGAPSLVEVNLPSPVKVEYVDDPFRMGGCFRALCTFRVFSPMIPVEESRKWEPPPDDCWAGRMADCIIEQMEEECTTR